MLLFVWIRTESESNQNFIRSESVSIGNLKNFVLIVNFGEHYETLVRFLQRKCLFNYSHIKK